MRQRILIFVILLIATLVAAQCSSPTPEPAAPEPAAPTEESAAPTEAAALEEEAATEAAAPEEEAEAEAAAPEEEMAESAEPEITDVILRLKWAHQFQSAGFDMALAQGFYEEEGLNVTIEPAGVDLKAPTTVASGAEHFGLAGPDQVLLGREQGAPFVGLMGVYQTSPTGYMVLADSGISSPEDFIGRSIGINYGSQTETEYRAMMTKLGLDTSQVQEVKLQFTLAPFLEREVDIWSVFVTDEPDFARQQGFEVNVIQPADYGINFYGDILFTTEEMIAEAPNTVEAFVRASIKGWRYAYEHPEETIAHLIELNDQLNEDHLWHEMCASNELMHGLDTEAHIFGWIDQGRWEAIQQDMIDLGIMQEAQDISVVMTTQFLEAAQESLGGNDPLATHERCQ